MKRQLVALALAACTPSRQDSASRESGLPDPVDSDPVPGVAVVLSLNLHCLRLDGTAFADNEERLDAVAQAVAAEGVGLIALQELCERDGESAAQLLVASLEEHTGTPWALEKAFAHVGWEGTEEEADEYVGLAVRGTVSASRAITFGVQEGLQRVAVQGLWESPLGALSVTSVHLDNRSASARRGQGRQAAIEGLVGEGSPASLILGDLNAEPDSDVVQDILAMGYRDLAAELDPQRIDHVLGHRGAPVQASGARRIFDGDAWPEVSDHPGILVELAAAEPEQVSLTALVAEVSVSDGHYLAVRGDGAPLDWDIGWPASHQDLRWRAVLSEIPGGSFAYKWLLDDATWQQGDDEVGHAGQENVALPVF